MNKTKKMLLTAAIFLILSPLGSFIISSCVFIPIIGIIAALTAAFSIALLIERLRRSFFFEINKSLFLLCAYVPGVIASFIVCIVFAIIPRAPEDLNGWGALARGVLGILMFFSQLALAIIGLILTLSAPKDYEKYDNDDTFNYDKRE